MLMPEWALEWDEGGVGHVVLLLRDSLTNTVIHTMSAEEAEQFQAELLRKMRVIKPDA
jgi:hypothetical protein